MNTLTLNRILQEGDEYLNGNNGAWTKVPKNDFGLQIQFSTYKKTQVRRPSEKPVSTLPNIAKQFSQAMTKAGAIGHEPISQKQQGVRNDQAAKAEKENAAIPTPSGIAVTPSQKSDRAIIDKIPYDQPMTDEEKAALDREIERQPKLIPAGTPAAEIKAGFSPSNGILKIKFPKTTTPPIWTGRNGTFNGYGLDLMQVADEVVMLSPIGKRGVGNACIQIPISVIPELVEWLNKQALEQWKKTITKQHPNKAKEILASYENAGTKS